MELRTERVKENIDLHDRFLCYEVFDSIDDLVSRVKNANTSRLFSNKDSQSSFDEGFRDGFHDYRTFDEAVTALEYGTGKYFKDFEKHFKKAKDFLARKEVSKRIKYKNDVVGFAPIVPNVIIGTPNNMVNMTAKPRQIPTARIVIEKGNSARIEVKDMLKYYTMIFAIVQLLEQRGVRCELWAVESSKEDDEILEFMTKIKEFNQPLNVYKIQFPVIASDYLRRIAFRVLETSELVKNTGWKWGYGSPLLCNDSYDLEEDGSPNENLSKVLRLEENDIYIPSYQWFDFDEADTLDSIMEAVIKDTLLNRYITLEK